MGWNPFVFQLVYTSVAIHPASESELARILHVARRNNERLRITGVLLYQDGTFMQALEGDEPAVHALFEKISEDPRHERATVLWSGNVGRRSFGEWSMGFASAGDGAVAHLEGYRDFFAKKSLAGVWSNPSRGTELLREFRELPWQAAMDTSRGERR